MAIQKFFKNPTNSWQVTWGGGPCQQGRLAGKKASPLGPACPIRLPRLKGLSRPQVQVKSPPARAAVGQALVGQHRSRVLKVYSRWCLLAFEARINERLPWDLPPGWQSGASTPVLPRLGVWQELLLALGCALFRAAGRCQCLHHAEASLQALDMPRHAEQQRPQLAPRLSGGQRAELQG